MTTEKEPPQVSECMAVKQLRWIALLLVCFAVSGLKTSAEARGNHDALRRRPTYCGPGPIVRTHPYLGVLPPKQPARAHGHYRSHHVHHTGYYGQSYEWGTWRTH